MCSLPESLLLNILNLLDPHTLLCEAPVVCKLWNALVYVAALRFAPVLPRNVTERSAWRQRVVSWLQRSKALKVLRYREHRALHDRILDDQAKSLCLAIGQLPDLEEVYMSSCPVTDMGLHPLKDLATLSQLQVLSLDCCGLRDQDLETLAPLTSLRHLDLSGNSFAFTSGAFSSLTGPLQQLTSLRLHNAASAGQLQHSHLDQLTKFSQLQALDISTCYTNLAHSPEFPSLSKLTADNVWVTATPGSLSSLSHLQQLQIRYCKFTEAAQDFSALARLTRLEASHYFIDDDEHQRGISVTALAPLKQLRHLAIDPIVERDAPTGISSFSLLTTLKHLTHLELCGLELPSEVLAAMFQPAAAAAAVPNHPAGGAAPAAGGGGGGGRHGDTATSSLAGGGAALPNLKYLSMVWYYHDYMTDWVWGRRDNAVGSDQLQQLVWNCPLLEVLAIKDHPVQVAGVAHLTALTGLRQLELTDVYYPLSESSSTIIQLVHIDSNSDIAAAREAVIN